MQEDVRQPGIFHRSSEAVVRTIVHDIFSPATGRSLMAILVAYSREALRLPPPESIIKSLGLPAPARQWKRFPAAGSIAKNPGCFPLAGIHAVRVPRCAVTSPRSGRRKLIRRSSMLLWINLAFPAMYGTVPLPTGGGGPYQSWANKDMYKRLAPTEILDFRRPRPLATDHSGLWTVSEPHWQRSTMVLDSAQQFTPPPTAFSLDRRTSSWQNHGSV